MRRRKGGRSDLIAHHSAATAQRPSSPAICPRPCPWFCTRLGTVSMVSVGKARASLYPTGEERAGVALVALALFPAGGEGGGVVHDPVDAAWEAEASISSGTCFDASAAEAMVPVGKASRTVPTQSLSAAAAPQRAHVGAAAAVGVFHQGPRHGHRPALAPGLPHDGGQDPRCLEVWRGRTR